MGILGPTKTNSAEKIVVPPPQQVKVDQSGPKFGHQSTMLVKDVKKESPGTGVHYEASKPPLDKEKIPPPLANNEKKSRSDKSSMGNGGSLASLWGRASAKSKLTSPPAGDNSLISDPAGSSPSSYFVKLKISLHNHNARLSYMHHASKFVVYNLLFYWVGEFVLIFLLVYNCY